MTTLNKYFRTTSLVTMLQDLSNTGESFLILNDLDNIPSAIRYANSALNKKGINASITKAQFICNNNIVTGLYLRKKEDE